MFIADLALETAVVLVTISKRMDSSQNCPRSLDFHPSCGYDACQQCSNRCIMLYKVGGRGTTGIVGKQLLDQLPQLEGNAIRSSRYGTCSFQEFDRSRVTRGYGEFIINESYSVSHT